MTTIRHYNEAVIRVDDEWFKTTVDTDGNADPELTDDGTYNCSYLVIRALADIEGSKADADDRDLKAIIKELDQLQEVIRKTGLENIEVTAVNEIFMDDSCYVELKINGQIYSNYITPAEAEIIIHAYARGRASVKPASEYVPLVTYYSFDPDVPVQLCETEEEAINKLKAEFEEELRIETEEQGHVEGEDMEVSHSNDWTEAQIRIDYEDTQDVMTWAIGRIC